MNVRSLIRGIGRRVRGERKRPPKEGRLHIAMGSDRQRASSTWFRGESTNFNPTRRNLAEADAVRDYILKGWIPEKPFVTTEDPITTFGSCFADHVNKYLKQTGYKVNGTDKSLRNSYVVRYGEGMANSFAVAQQFEWAFGERSFDEALWFDKGAAEVEYSDTVREATRQLFLGTDVFIVTLGLSEVWLHKETGDVFWRAIPQERYNPARHGFKISTVAENLANLETVHRLVRTHRPKAALIVTLSPIPLVATFRPVSCITADAVSKAVLRVAVDEFMRSHVEDRALFYFPSYEIVKRFAKDPYQDDNRHVKPEVVDLIMSAFGRSFLVPPR